MINSAKQNKKEKKRRESKKVRAKNRNDHGLLTLRERIPKQHNPCRQSSVTTTLILRIFRLVCVRFGRDACVLVVLSKPLWNPCLTGLMLLKGALTGWSIGGNCQKISGLYTLN